MSDEAEPVIYSVSKNTNTGIMVGPTDGDGEEMRINRQHHTFPNFFHR